jgi:hypothetical protein
VADSCGRGNETPDSITSANLIRCATTSFSSRALLHEVSVFHRVADAFQLAPLVRRVAYRLLRDVAHCD